jgi:hypothetical protein
MLKVTAHTLAGNSNWGVRITFDGTGNSKLTAAKKHLFSWEGFLKYVQLV